MTYSYIPRGVCSRKIDVTVEDGIVKDVRFTGGCSGNTQGVAALCIGRKPEELIPLMEHINCGGKGTSCPAQLAIALKQAIGK
ncbi:MAG: TIGR03905 family TSCPD domain-containing protein [Oscillospiraceae bacterium]|nr:TIGR03905 family TSCPD domain-containing protein [Oscillospiraceae bacterium]